ncbi:hypothetical protein GCM10009609_19400 [Pseudonocardia aurantiaca]
MRSQCPVVREQGGQSRVRALDDPAHAQVLRDASDLPTVNARPQTSIVLVTDVRDEHTFGRELENHLGRARQSVWMWSPWIANRAR